MSLGDRVGVVTILPNVVPMLRSLTRRYGLDGRLGSIRVVDMPVLGLTDREELVDRLAAQRLRQWRTVRPIPSFSVAPACSV